MHDSLSPAAIPATTPTAPASAARCFPSFKRTVSKIGGFGRRNWRKILVFFAILFTLHSAFNLYASFVLNRELAAIRATGDPLTFAELASPAVPPAQNGADYYRRATAKLRLTRPESHDLSLGWKQSSQATLAATKILDQNREAVELAKQGGLQHAANFGTDWNADLFKIAFPQYQELRSLHSLLRADARRRAAAGDTAAALLDVRAMFGMANQASSDPVLIGFLVARGLDAVANQTLADVLRTVPLSTNQAREFENSLPVSDWSATLRRCMLGERAFGIAAFEKVQKGETGIFEMTGEPLNRPAAFFGHLGKGLWSPWLKLDEVYSLRIWQTVVAGMTPMKVPAPPRDTSEATMVQEVPSYAVLTRMVMPAFYRTRYLRDGMEVDARQREIALALAAYRTAHGTYPPDLKTAENVWGQHFRPDLYRSRPMVYHPMPDSFLLYSVGPNGHDDQGRGAQGLERRHLKSSDRSSADDIAWGSGGQ